MNRYQLNTDSPDRYRFLRYALYLLVLGLFGVVMLR